VAGPLHSTDRLNALEVYGVGVGVGVRTLDLHGGKSHGAMDGLLRAYCLQYCITVYGARKLLCGLRSKALTASKSSPGQMHSLSSTSCSVLVT
jgi:hypothetical protein